MLKFLSFVVSALLASGSNLVHAETWQPLPEKAASPKDNLSTPEKVELGKKLYFDPRLSATGTVSCNTCHNLMEGGDDGRATSMGVHGLVGPRNAPTVWNSAFQGAQFWDGRSPSLEDQAKGPIIAAPEMGMPSHDVAIERIKAIPGYREEFQKVFGQDSINIENATKAIAAFERILITPDSPFDRYLQGDQQAMTPAQIRGMKRFENVGCTECHAGPALNGWTSADEKGNYAEFPRFGISDDMKKYEFKEDLGRYEATKKDSDKHYFKVPLLRNITLTAPYFHNGKVDTLKDAIRIMAETQLATELSDSDVADIEAFFGSLEGRFPEITLPRLPSRPGKSVIEEVVPTSELKKSNHQSKTENADRESHAQAHFQPPGRRGGPGHRGLGRRRGQGRGRGPHGAGDAKLEQDHAVFFFLLKHRQEITRRVTDLKNGVETLTESKNPKVAAKIREHVASMYDRVEQKNPIHMRDPLFREIFRHADQVEMKTEKTKNGIRVIETSKNPYVAKLIQAHARVVSAFLKNGHQELRKNHHVPQPN